MGANQKSRRHKMTKHASTSYYIGKDDSSGCSGVPLPLLLPTLSCSLLSLCMPSLLLLSPLSPLMPWNYPRAAVAANYVDAAINVGG
jgi:hypothetical protein